MVDRIPSDHPSVDTFRATVGRYGGRRFKLELPEEQTHFSAADDVVEVIVDERRRFVRCRQIDGQIAFVGLYDTNAAASGEVAGQDDLKDWLATNDRGIGSSVLVDVIDAGATIGLRIPGDRTVYQAPRTQDGSLNELARNLLDET